MKKILTPSLVLLLIFAAVSSGAQAVPPAEDQPSPYADAIKAFESYVVEQMAFDGIPGLSVGFIKGDFSWAKGFGLVDLENLVPAKPESSYRIASITKTMTAVAVLKLVDEGKIDLDTEIQTYLPYFPRKKWPVTVRQLLGHIGGISHYMNYAVEGHIKEPKTTREALAIFQDFDLVAEPGTKFNYSSYGYNLLGAAIEAASGLSYGEYLKNNVFEPLGMSDSRLDSPRDIIPNRVSGYLIVRGKLRNSEYLDLSSRFAAAGVRSTVLDLLKYARGIYEGDLLQRATWKKMFSPMALRYGLFTWYGMGWWIQPWHAHFAVSHAGILDETRAYLLIFPADRFAVAIVSNLEGSNLLPYVRRLTELVLDEDINSYAYASDKESQAIYGALHYAFSYGLSAYEWNKTSLSTNWNELREAFGYFNEAVNEQKLRQDFKEAKKRIQAGIHLVSSQAFAKVGSYMARALEEERGKEKLLSYHQTGPIAFFSDYIKLSTGNPTAKKHPRFKPEFAKLIAAWDAEWSRTYTADVRNLELTPGTDFEKVTAKLKEAFAGASLYPDFTAALAEEAEYYLRTNNADKAISILNSGRALYPASSLIHSSLGLACLCRGDVETASQFYKKAYDLDFSHPRLSLDQLIESERFLLRLNQRQEAAALLSIALEFYPKEARLYVELGDLSFAAGQKDRSAEYYKKALEIDPNNEEAKTRLKNFEK